MMCFKNSKNKVYDGSLYLKLSLKNVKKSFKDYTIYFFTLIVGVSIFYMFNSMDSQAIMLELSDTKHKMLEQMSEVLDIISVLVVFVLAFLIIYASRFLMKRRKKEFGIYMLLGMKKGKISRIILIETLLVGIISLIVGLGIGIVLSQLMSIIVANMFEANMTKFAFTFSKVALIKTILYFAIIYVIVMIFNVISVNKCKLIDLINSNKKTEKVKLKNVTLCIILFLTAIILLGYAYYNVTVDKGANIDSKGKLLWMIILGCIATFLVFWSLSGMLLKMTMSIKKVYYKSVNSFVIKQLSSKVNTTVFSVTIICLMLFVTICIFSTAMSLKDSMNEKVEKLAPVDISISKTLDIRDGDYGGEQITNKILNESQHKVEETLERSNINLNQTFQNFVSVNTYHTEQLTLKDLLGDTKEEALEGNPSLKLSMDEKEPLMKISDYNQFAKICGRETYLLKDNEYMVIGNMEYMTGLINKALKTEINLKIGEKEYKPKFVECKYGNLDLDISLQMGEIILLPDDAITEKMERGRNIFLANYNANTKEEKLAIEEKLTSLEKNLKNFYILTRQNVADENIGFGAMVVFLGLYLGMVFLISSGAILALKELSESSDNQERYAILRKIGTDEKTINKALFKQIGIFFLFPLVLAIIHSIPGIRVANYITESFGKGNLLIPTLMTAGFIILIYGGYFLISYYSSKRIIREK